jgi:hypothetical protein
MESLVSPAYSLGRIFNKHLIFEVFSYVACSDLVFPLIHGLNRRNRSLITKNYEIARTITIRSGQFEMNLGVESFDKKFQQIEMSDCSLF